MTVEKGRVSQVSQLEWERAHLHRIESSEGYQILAIRGVDGQWVYLASGPKEKLTQDNDRLFFRGLEYKTSYQVGEQVPPAYSYRDRSARQYIGHFHQVRFGSTDAALAAAKAACAQDRADQVAGPSEPPGMRGCDARNTCSHRTGSLLNDGQETRA